MHSVKHGVLFLIVLVVLFGCAGQQSPVEQKSQETVVTTSPTDEELRAENARLRIELAKAEQERKTRRAEEERRTEEVRESEATGQTPTSSPSATVTAHRINDTQILKLKPGDSVYLFLVVKPDLSESDAWAIINTYERQYSKAFVLNIDMLCSSAYATRKYAFDPLVQDREYYRHVLYTFMRGPEGRHFHSPSNPNYDGQGSECRRDAGL